MYCITRIFGGQSPRITKRMRPQITVLNSVTQQAINGHTPLVYWYHQRQKQTFEF